VEYHVTDHSRTRNLEFGLFALAFGLALALRMLRLDTTPLSDGEASLALQAFNLTKGLGAGAGQTPGYVNLTALVFYLIQASNFAARLVPALFGAALSLLPYQFRDRLGSKAAILLAFMLVIDPGFLGLSRMADGPIMAVCALLFAFAAWRNANMRAAGIWSGLALLSGPFLWPGLLGMGITYALLRGFFVQETQGQQPVPAQAVEDLSMSGLPMEDRPVEQNALVFEPAQPRSPLITLAMYAAGTYFLLGSFFLLASGGLSAGLAGIPAYFGGWLDFTDVPVWRLLVGLLAYELMPLIFALVALVRGIRKGDELTISLGIWLAVTLVLALANPSRHVSDLVWVMVPLLVLAAREICTYLVPIEDGKWETITMTVITTAILTLAFLNYSTLALVPLDAAALQLRWWVELGLIALLSICIAMMAFGWSIATARQAGLWASLIVLSVYTISSAMASAGLRTYRTVELWSSSPVIVQDETLIRQMNDLSRWKAGMNGALDVSIVELDNSPALHWILRDWPLTVSSGSGISGMPAIVIASTQFPSTSLETTYRGQDLTWRKYPGWNQGLLGDWLRWSILHDYPSGEENIILWVRNDVFIDSQNNP
jgi:hypothetical protein